MEQPPEFRISWYNRVMTEILLVDDDRASMGSDPMDAPWTHAKVLATPLCVANREAIILTIS